MRSLLARSLARLLWPGLLPVLVAIIWLNARTAPDHVNETWIAMRYLSAALAVLLAVRLDRGRVLWAAISLLVGAEVLSHYAGTAGSSLTHAVAFTVSLNFALISFAGDVVIRARFSMLMLGVLVIELGWLALVATSGEPLQASWLGWEVHLLDTETLNLSIYPATLASWSTSALLLLRFAHRSGPIDSGLVGTHLAQALAWAVPIDSTVSHGLVTVGLGVLALAVIERTYQLAYRDPLTGLPGRRALADLMDRLTGTYVIAVVDVDRFKNFNDSHGHDAGDHALRMVAFKLAEIRGGGRAFRHGGEEFVVIFPSATLEDALVHLEEVRERIAGHAFTIRSARRPRQRPARPERTQPSGKTVHLSVSIGAACPQDAETAPEAVLAAADTKLYEAKRGGRNRLAS
jgi:diguanylate cyclase (GGDEF)-like protein